MVESGVSAAHDNGGVNPRALAWVAGFIDTPNSQFGKFRHPKGGSMRSRSLMFCVMSLVFVPGASLAGGSDTGQMTATLMAKSGLDKQLEQFPQLVVAGLEQAAKQRQDLSQARLSKLRRAVIAGFEPQDLRTETAHYLAEHLPAKDMSAVLQWLRSPLGEEITHLEEAASTPEAYAQMQSMAAELTKNPSRVKAIKRFDDMTHATDATVQMVIASQVAFTTALAAAAQPSTPPSISAITRTIEAHRSELSASLAQLTQVSLLYSYRTLGDAELDQYLAFADKDFARRYHQGYNRWLLEGCRSGE
ncbi:MAG: DUF2059 domain-containing protein [Candidatus Binatia bacterium]